MRNELVSFTSIVEQLDPSSLLLSAVYVLFDGEDCLYVGQSKNVNARVRTHEGNGLLITDAYAIRCDMDLLDNLEPILIHRLKPVHNIRKPRNRRMTITERDRLLRMGVSDSGFIEYDYPESHVVWWAKYDLTYLGNHPEN
jgi:hypothetical protein